MKSAINSQFLLLLQLIQYCSTNSLQTNVLRLNQELTVFEQCSVHLITPKLQTKKPTLKTPIGENFNVEPLSFPVLHVNYLYRENHMVIGKNDEGLLCGNVRFRLHPNQTFGFLSILSPRLTCDVQIYIAPLSCSTWNINVNFPGRSHVIPYSRNRLDDAYRSRRYFILVSSQQQNADVERIETSIFFGIDTRLPYGKSLVQFRTKLYFKLELIPNSESTEYHVKSSYVVSSPSSIESSNERYHFHKYDYKEVSTLAEIEVLEKFPQSNSWIISCLHCNQTFMQQSIGTAEVSLLKWKEIKSPTDLILLHILSPNFTNTLKYLGNPSFIFDLSNSQLLNPQLFLLEGDSKVGDDKIRQLIEFQQGYHFVTCAVPEQNQIVKMIILVSAFDMKIWFSILFSCVISGIALLLILRHKKDKYAKLNPVSTFLFAFDLLLDHHCKAMDKCRFIGGSWLLVVIVLIVGYEGWTIEILTKPNQPRRYESFHELKSSRFSFYSPNMKNLRKPHKFKESYYRSHFEKIFHSWWDLGENFKYIGSRIAKPESFEEAKEMKEGPDYFSNKLKRCANNDAFIGSYDDAMETYLRLKDQVRENRSYLTISKHSLRTVRRPWFFYNVPWSADLFTKRVHSLMHSGITDLWNAWKMRINTWEVLTKGAVHKIEVKSLAMSGNIVVTYLHPQSKLAACVHAAHAMALRNIFCYLVFLATLQDVIPNTLLGPTLRFRQELDIFRRCSTHLMTTEIQNKNGESQGSYNIEPIHIPLLRSTYQFRESRGIKTGVTCNNMEMQVVSNESSDFLSIAHSRLTCEVQIYLTPSTCRTWTVSPYETWTSLIPGESSSYMYSNHIYRAGRFFILASTFKSRHHLESLDQSIFFLVDTMCLACPMSWGGDIAKSMTKIYFHIEFSHEWNEYQVETTFIVFPKYSEGRREIKYELLAYSSRQFIKSNDIENLVPDSLSSKWFLVCPKCQYYHPGIRNPFSNPMPLGYKLLQIMSPNSTINIIRYGFPVNSEISYVLTPRLETDARHNIRQLLELKDNLHFITCAAPEPEGSRIFIESSFDKKSWLAIFLSCVVSGLAMIFILRCRKDKFAKLNPLPTFLFAFELLLDHHSRVINKCRFIGGAWMFAVIILVGGCGGCNFQGIVLPSMPLMFHDMRDLISNGIQIHIINPLHMLLNSMWHESIDMIREGLTSEEGIHKNLRKIMAECDRDAFVGKFETVQLVSKILEINPRVKTILLSRPLGTLSEPWIFYNIPWSRNTFVNKVHSLIHSGLLKFLISRKTQDNSGGFEQKSGFIKALTMADDDGGSIWLLIYACGVLLGVSGLLFVVEDRKQIWREIKWFCTTFLKFLKRLRRDCCGRVRDPTRNDCNTTSL
ncbi:unnamed protein product [Orchesella dallaii]|uniref:Uncharacterized protein n=1 Tax=Orchesella dallaii TaxID=48710 RepID=A0ABP1S8V9_9HEXA